VCGVTNLETYELWPTFPGEQNFSTTDISHTFCRSATKFGSVNLPIETYFANFVKTLVLFLNKVSVSVSVPCGDMHQSFTGTLVIVKWFFDNFPMFADSFSGLSIHCVARKLGASFLYKCPVSRGGSCDSTAFLFFFVTEQQLFSL